MKTTVFIPFFFVVVVEIRRNFVSQQLNWFVSSHF